MNIDETACKMWYNSIHKTLTHKMNKGYCFIRLHDENAVQPDRYPSSGVHTFLITFIPIIDFRIILIFQGCNVIIA